MSYSDNEYVFTCGLVTAGRPATALTDAADSQSR
jgi:hypothetical protein